MRKDSHAHIRAFTLSVINQFRDELLPNDEWGNVSARDQEAIIASLAEFFDVVHAFILRNK